MANDSKNIKEQLSIGRIIWPVLIGILVVVYISYTSFNVKAFLKIDWSGATLWWVLLGALFMAGRHIGYMYRVRLLTDYKIGWRQSFEVITVWEFGSAVTPSTVGGAAVAMFLLAREKISLGRSTGIVLLITLLDNLFFVLLVPLVYLIVGHDGIFPADPACLENINFPALRSLNSISGIFLIGYGLFFVFVVLFFYGLFINPTGLKNVFIKTFSLKWLKRWKEKAIQTGEDLVITSREFQNKSLAFWVKLSSVTLVSWTIRFLVLNCTLIAFGDPGHHVTIFARQFVMWIIMLLPTTPGSSGVAEIAFVSVQCEFLAEGLQAPIVLVWRFLSYYGVLLLGIFILPRWLRRVF